MRYYCNYCCLICYYKIQIKKIYNFLSFCQILMILLPKCRAYCLDLEKGHGAGKKGMMLEQKGIVKVARGNTSYVLLNIYVHDLSEEIRE